MKTIAIALLLSSCTQAVRINNKDIEFRNDEEKYIHQFRHAAALEKALQNATFEEKEQLATEMEGGKQYHGDWNNIDGPDDSETPLYYRTEPIDKIFREAKIKKAKDILENEERKQKVAKAAVDVLKEEAEQEAELKKKPTKKGEEKEYTQAPKY